VAGQPSEQAGPQDDAREYLSDDGRLPAFPCRRAKQRGDYENQRYITADSVRRHRPRLACRSILVLLP
jgi:hypothetical protein